MTFLIYQTDLTFHTLDLKITGIISSFSVTSDSIKNFPAVAVLAAAEAVALVVAAVAAALLRSYLPLVAEAAPVAAVVVAVALRIVPESVVFLDN